MLEKHGYACEVYDSQDVLADAERLMGTDLIVPCWTMGRSSRNTPKTSAGPWRRAPGWQDATGGMCDAFRQDVEWQFMTGGQWVSHPGGDGVDYTVNIRKGSSPIVAGIEDFHVCSEHYYLHVDPAVEVLASTRFPVVDYYHSANKAVDMPVAWTKFWGERQSVLLFPGAS